jgi:hypothetical protein
MNEVKSEEVLADKTVMSLGDLYKNKDGNIYIVGVQVECDSGKPALYNLESGYRYGNHTWCLKDIQNKVLEKLLPGSVVTLTVK